MTQFPTDEEKIHQLARAIVFGIWNNPVFPKPPCKITLLSGIKRYENFRNNELNYLGALSAAITAKDKALEELCKAMKKDLRYAEIITGGDDEKLKLLGWAARRQRHSPCPPGQPMGLRAKMLEDGSLELIWKPPVDGGKVLAYKVQARELPQGNWQDFWVSMATSARLDCRSRGSSRQWRIIAANKAGEGMPSNIVMTVL